MKINVITVAIYLILISFSSLVLSAEREIIESLRWVESANPLEDVKEAISKKDYRFIGIAGRRIKVRGIPDDKYFEYTEKYGINVMKGTSDITYGDEHLRLIRLAEDYAKKYNQVLLRHLGQLTGK